MIISIAVIPRLQMSAFELYLPRLVTAGGGRGIDGKKVATGV